MSSYYHGGELVEIAMGMELIGIAFYTALAGAAKKSEVRSIYRSLAAEEKKHLETFESMLKSFRSYQPDEAYAGEYQSYLKALASDTVFSSTEDAEQKARSAPGDIEAIAMAIQTEKDSILFYQGLRGFVRPADRAIIDTIIKEERAHLVKLNGIKALFQK